MKFSEIKEILSKKTVGIAGAGGLGSKCAEALVRSGIGKLVVVDFDIVDESNLNRQFYFTDQLGSTKVSALGENLRRINPDLILQIVNTLINKDNIQELFDDIDVLVEALDMADQKEMFIETALEKWPERPLVVGSGLAGFGNTRALETRKYGNLYVCGDEKEEISLDNPPLAPRVGIVACMQADVVLQILLKA